jgi:hypothetical protein
MSAEVPSAGPLEASLAALPFSQHGYLLLPTATVCLNSKFPPLVELCWQNKNISKLGIVTYNQSW